MMRSQAGNPPGVFEVFDMTLAQATPDVLGIWTTSAPAPSTGVAFDTTAVTGDQVPCWQAHLPADPVSAHRCLLEGEARLLASQQALPRAADRFETFVRQEVSQQAFNVPSSGMALQPEAELFHLLQTLQGPATSFGLGEQLTGEWNQAIQQFQTFIDKLLKVVTHYAWVETYVGEQLLGRTAVSWTGDINTVWQAGLTPEQIALHQHTLALALASRIMLMRIFVLVARGSIIVSTLLTTPAGPLLLAPTVWKFINQVLAEYSQYQQLLIEA